MAPIRLHTAFIFILDLLLFKQVNQLLFVIKDTRTPSVLSKATGRIGLDSVSRHGDYITVLLFLSF